MPFPRLMPLVAAAALFTSPSARVEETAAAPPAIIGTWLLESIVDALGDGTHSYWMGERPSGALIYTASGHMSVQFMRDPRPAISEPQPGDDDAAKLAGADPFAALDVDTLRELVRGYYAYFGRYEVAPGGDAITHFVETSLRPGEVGIEYRRAIRIEGDRLSISLDAEVGGVPRRRVLTWRRAPVDDGAT